MLAWFSDILRCFRNVLETDEFHYVVIPLLLLGIGIGCRIVADAVQHRRSNKRVQQKQFEAGIDLCLQGLAVAWGLGANLANETIISIRSMIGITALILILLFLVILILGTRKSPFARIGVANFIGACTIVLALATFG